MNIFIFHAAIMAEGWAKSVTYGRFDTIFILEGFLTRDARLGQCLKALSAFLKKGFFREVKKSFFVIGQEGRFSANENRCDSSEGFATVSRR
jgi:hypothetical protein